MPRNQRWTLLASTAHKEFARVMYEMTVYERVQKLLRQQNSRHFPYLLGKSRCPCTFARIRALTPVSQHGEVTRSIEKTLVRMSGSVTPDLVVKGEQDNKVYTIRRGDIPQVIRDDVTFMYLATEYIDQPAETRGAGRSIGGADTKMVVIRHLLENFAYSPEKYKYLDVMQVVFAVLYNVSQLAQAGINHNDLHTDNILLTQSYRRDSKTGVVESKAYLVATPDATYYLDAPLYPVLFDFDRATMSDEPNSGNKDTAPSGQCYTFMGQRDCVKFLFGAIREIIDTSKDLGSVHEDGRDFIAEVLGCMAPKRYTSWLQDLVYETSEVEPDGVWLDKEDLGLSATFRDDAEEGKEDKTVSLLCSPKFLGIFYSAPEMVRRLGANAKLEATRADVKRYKQQFQKIKDAALRRAHLEKNVYFDQRMTAAQRDARLRELAIR
jgi:Asp-tRNA(Asn)/Glu-tRNA(Gln) amidotransferase C subunit